MSCMWIKIVTLSCTEYTDTQLKTDLYLILAIGTAFSNNQFCGAPHAKTVSVIVNQLRPHDAAQCSKSKWSLHQIQNQTWVSRLSHCYQ